MTPSLKFIGLRRPLVEEAGTFAVLVLSTPKGDLRRIPLDEFDVSELLKEGVGMLAVERWARAKRSSDA